MNFPRTVRLCLVAATQLCVEWLECGVPINPFHAIGFFLYLLNKSENQMFSDFFQEV